MPTAIRRVSFYTASPVETCDRCGQGIKHVALVQYKDDHCERFGLDCINKVLAGDNSLKSLFTNNAKMLKRYTSALEVLNRPEDEMPRGMEYYGSGFYFIAGEDGKNIGIGQSLFHPLSDFVKNRAGNKYTLDDRMTRVIDGTRHANNEEGFQLQARGEIKKMIVRYQGEIARLEGFLARILAKGLATEAQMQEAVSGL